MKDFLTFPTLLLLGALLIVARICGWITCSWWLITFPLWFPIALIALVVLLFGLMFLFVIVQELIISWKHNRQKPK